MLDMEDGGFGMKEPPAGNADATLHAGDGIICFACNGAVQAGAEIRITPKGTRHDTCP